MTTSVLKKQPPSGGQEAPEASVANPWCIFFDKKGRPIEIGRLWDAFSPASTMADEKAASDVINKDVINKTEAVSTVDEKIKLLLSPLELEDEEKAINQFYSKIETTDLPELLLMALVNDEFKKALMTHIRRSDWEAVIKNQGKPMRRYWRRLDPKPHPLEALLHMRHLELLEIKSLAEEQPKFVIGVLLKLSELNPEVFNELILKLLPTKTLIDLTYQSEDLHRAIPPCKDDKELAERWFRESERLGSVVNTVHPFNRIAGNTLFTFIRETYEADKDKVHYGRQLERILPFQGFDTFRQLLTVKLESIVECMENNIALPNQEDIQQVIELAEQATGLFATPGHLLAAETHVHLAKYFSMQNDHEQASEHNAKVLTHLSYAKELESEPLSRQVMSVWCWTTDLSVAFDKGYIQLITDRRFENWEHFIAETKVCLAATTTTAPRCR